MTTFRAYGSPEPGKPAMVKAGDSLAGRHHWRALTPDQERAVKQAYADGASGPALAEAYGVHLRTIWRTLHRADRPTFEVVLAGYRATFELTEEGAPIQSTPWVAKVDNSGG